MPVTAKLSRKFYEKLGDEIANELVDWFNQVDLAYRTEFRELFEVHFARFDAKLEQRIAELKAELHAEFATRFAGQEGKFTGLEAQFAAKFAGLETKFAGLESRLVKWMFLFWATSLGALIALQKL